MSSQAKMKSKNEQALQRLNILMILKQKPCPSFKENNYTIFLLLEHGYSLLFKIIKMQKKKLLRESLEEVLFYIKKMII